MLNTSNCSGWHSALLAGWLLTSIAIGSAVCSVPVFRYALLWWGPQSTQDCYQALVFHHGPMDREQTAALDQLERHAWTEEGGANYVVVPIDLDDSPQPHMQAIWAAETDASEPWVVLRYPPTSRVKQNAWATPLKDANLAVLLASPKRKEIASRLLAGETAVWILLESGDASKDDDAAKLLGTRIAKLETELKLPEEKDDPIDTAADRALEAAAVDENLPPLQIKFSTLRLSRDDADDQLLVRLLRKSEADLDVEFAHLPIVFPVFGRGRTLWALAGGGINDDMITKYAGYLVGMCSCEIKAQNPGFDLLLNTDWNQRLKPANSPVSTAVGRLPGTIEAPVQQAADATEQVTTTVTGNLTPTPAESRTPPASTRLLWGILAAIGVAITGAIAITLWVLLRPSGSAR